MNVMETDCVVIGAGVVGLAIARNLAQAGRDVVIIEAADAIGTATSSRNSEVIHAGLYYQPGSLKARFCVAGKAMLYEYCASHGISHQRLGKLIVATDDSQRATLDQIQARAAACGVTDLAPLTAAEVRALEPDLACVAALLSPSTGIIDSHGLMLALQGDAEQHGAMIAFNTPVLGGRIGDGRIELACGGADPLHLTARAVVNAAGLGAQAIGRALAGLPPESVPPLYFAKGNYFSLAGRTPFRRLIYPVPEQAGLGVHVTLDLGGQARFGPDVEWVQDLYYPVDPARAEPFYAAVRRYWPGLADAALQPAYAGIRPKLTAPGQAAADFVIQGPLDHGVPGLVCLYGIESPGLTGSMAIAAHVGGLLGVGV